MTDMVPYAAKGEATIRESLATSVDQEIEKLVARLVREAERLNGLKNPDPKQIADIRRGFVTVLAAGRAYQASPQRLGEVTTVMVESTFPLVYAAGMRALESREDGAEGDLNTLFGGSGLELLLRTTTGVSAPARGSNGTGRSESRERARDGGRQRAKHGFGVEDYVPSERRVPDSEYRGFKGEDMAEALGYAEGRASQVVAVVRRKAKADCLQIIGKTGDSGKQALYDFRGVAYRFVRERDEQAGTALYTQAEALKVIQVVLMLEGVRVEYREKDATGILGIMEQNIDDLKAGGKYRGVRLSKEFPAMARSFYKMG